MTMKIKRFDGILNESVTTSNNKILTYLETGFAICILKADTGKFLTILSSFEGLDIPGTDTIPQFTSDKAYFVMIGNRVLHTTTPTFGGDTFKVFTPTL